MLILKILGIIDIIAGLIFWLSAIFNIIPNNIILIIGFYLLVKGAVFLISRDIASIIDILCAGVIFLSLNFTLPRFLPIIVTLFLIQKGIFSLLS